MNTTETATRVAKRRSCDTGPRENWVIKPRSQGLSSYPSVNNPQKIPKTVKDPEIVLFLRREPFNRKFREKNKIDLKFIAKKIPIIWDCLARYRNYSNKRGTWGGS